MHHQFVTDRSGGPAGMERESLEAGRGSHGGLQSTGELIRGDLRSPPGSNLLLALADARSNQRLAGGRDGLAG
jgi:hypothetical protein